MSDEVGFVGRQYGTEKPQVMKFTESGKRTIDVTADSKGKRRLIAKQAEEDKFLVIDEFFNQLSFQHYRVRRIAAYQAPIAPYGDKTALITAYRTCKPVRILASFADSIDECAREYVLVIHAGSPAAVSFRLMA